jgi:hypothetical protein
MTTRARKLREEARQALYSTPNDQECEVPIMVATLRAVVSLLQYDNADWQEPNDHMIINVKDVLELANDLEALK